MPHLTYLPGDRAVPGYAAADLDVDDETAAYLLAAMHSDGTPLYIGAGAPGNQGIDEGPEARLALRNRNTAWIEAAQAADAEYAAAHASPEPTAPVDAPADPTPEPAAEVPAIEPMIAPVEAAPEVAPNVDVSAADGAGATSARD